MNFFDLVDIAERELELVNPTSPTKILALGRALGLREGMRVIDFGCGYAEVLCLWAENFGIHGVGVEVRQTACGRAREKIAARTLQERIEIVCAPGESYAFDPHAFDVALCIGATFIWGGYAPTLRALSPTLRPGGRLAIGELYWRVEPVPPALAARQPEALAEMDLLRLARTAGCEVATVIHSSQEEWDRYESANWRALLAWLKENPDHPDRPTVLAHLRASQEEYFQFGRRSLGWALLALVPAG